MSALDLYYRGKCRHCHQRLTKKAGYTPAARFCSATCRAKYWRFRRRVREYENDKRCKACLKPIGFTQRSDAQFCSNACRQQAYRYRLRRRETRP
jgi:hypothetical protein